MFPDTHTWMGRFLEEIFFQNSMCLCVELTEQLSLFTRLQKQSAEGWLVIRGGRDSLAKAWQLSLPLNSTASFFLSLVSHFLLCCP